MFVIAPDTYYFYSSVQAVGAQKSKYAQCIGQYELLLPREPPVVLLTHIRTPEIQ